MQDLIKQEEFELEVLDRLNTKKLLSGLVFTGGTMLRLCFGLGRFSVDLDFWVVKEADNKKLFESIRRCLGEFYMIKDSANKFRTLLFEIKSKDYPRSLKIEIRKETKKIKTETAIAYSKYSNAQVFLRVVTLADMMRAKIKAFLERKEIRDVFDMEFLLKRGASLDAPSEALKKVSAGIERLTKRDYTVKLGSLLEEGQRKYYASENFKILKSAIGEKIRKAPD
jgi:predicted nucleotidyltransferase component of viral defense system